MNAPLDTAGAQTRTVNPPATMPVAEVRFRDDLYPRIQHSPQTVQQYAEDLSVLPPIEVNQHGELIDGWHRWTAHKEAGAAEIAVTVTQTNDDDHFIGLAANRNSAGNDRLSVKEKRKLARDLYRNSRCKDEDGNPIPVPLENVGERKDWLAEQLKVSRRTIDVWTSRIDKDRRIEFRETIARKWLQCWTVPEMEKAGLGKRQSIERVLTDFAQNRNAAILGKDDDSGSISDDFAQTDPDYTDSDWFPYNVWKKQDKSNEVSHGGNTEVEWLDRLIWAYTEPFSTVIDPFAGGGSTADVCFHRYRRHLVSDIAPIEARKDVIRQHDATEGPIHLKPSDWKDVRLVYLDPPYWIQQEYGHGPTDLSSMDADAFHDALAKVIRGYAVKVPAGCKIALIIQPTQWKAPDRRFTDHMAEMIRRVDYMPVVQRIQVPYESQQATAQMVEWAKNNRQWLVLSREIIVWEKE